MNTMGEVIVGIDGTRGSHGALRYGITQAQARQCVLGLVHVGPRYLGAMVVPYSTEQVDAVGSAILAQTKDQVHRQAPGLSVRTHLRVGSRIAELVDVSAHGQEVILGRESHTGMERVLLGATTAAVVARSAVATTVVPADWESPPRTPGRVVVAFGLPDGVDTLLHAAFTWADAHKSSVEVVHAWKMPDPYLDQLEDLNPSNQWVASATDMIQRALGPWQTRHPDVPATINVIHAPTIGALLNAARGASVLMVLRRPRTPLLGEHLGRVIRAVIHSAPCPVQVLPAPTGDSAEIDLELERGGELLRESTTGER